jgi:peptidoglycan-associated lipoprotein
MKTTSFRNRNLTLTASAFMAVALFSTGCGKHTPIPPPPPAPSAGGGTTADNGPSLNPGRPIATLTAEPSRIEAGETSTLSWTTTNANDVSINNGIGTVAATGRQSVSPINTTTYTLTANGPNGSTTATATVTITSPPPPPTPEVRRPSSTGTLESRVQSDLKDAFFDYDAVSIREDARTSLMADADALKRIFNDFPSAVINVEGHCDERGSAEYNLGLGDRRATSAKDFLVQLGVPAAKLRTISYGKERPQCTEADEACYQKNRRVHLSAGQ